MFSLVFVSRVEQPGCIGNIKETLTLMDIPTLWDI